MLRLFSTVLVILPTRDSFSPSGCVIHVMKKNSQSSTLIADFQIKNTTVEDVPLIFSFIRKLAEYERLSHAVVATEDVLALRPFFVTKLRRFAPHDKSAAHARTA